MGCLDEIAASGELVDSGRKLSTFSDNALMPSLSQPTNEPTGDTISCDIKRVSFLTQPTGETLRDIALPFTASELSAYVSNRLMGLAELSCRWIKQSAKTFWESTEGIISCDTMEKLRAETMQRYRCVWSYSKTLSFAKSFLSHLTKTRLDSRYVAFEVFLAMPKTVKVRKATTSRIITQADIKNVLSHIKRAEGAGKISKQRALQYTAFVVFGAYTGQRTLATMSRLKVRQFRAALQMEKPVLLVNAEQDKIRMEHYVPLHPQVVQAIKPLLEGTSEDERMFAYNSLVQWLKQEKIPLARIAAHFTLGDLRKFTEQHGDVIGWDQSNRAYIMTHGVSGIDWKHYKHPLPENVYDVYMQYWADVRLACDDPCADR